MTAAERALQASGCDAVLASDPFTVAWLTGFGADTTWGPNPFAVPPLALVRADGAVTAVVSADEAPALEGAGCEVASYEGFTTGPLDPAARQLAAVRALAVSGRVAVEAGSLPLAVARALPGELVDRSDELRRARAVKSSRELERIRAAIRLCDVGQAAARRCARAGASELELWSEVQGAMEVAAGERLPLLVDFVSGERTAEVGGPPSSRVVREGELMLVDLVPRLAAYWGDSCSTFAVGEPPDAAREGHARCVEALERTIAAIRPGVVAGDLDRICREGLDYPHHSGHGLGTAAHEEPRIVPDGDTVLEAGMVVALEPGTYPGPWGVRVERIVVVTDDGAEVLSGHDLSLER